MKSCNPLLSGILYPRGVFLWGFLLLILVPQAPCWSQTREVPVDSLIFDLKNPDPVRRRDAAKILGVNKIHRATPDLVAAAGDADPSVRREIVIALDNMLDSRALPAFINLTGDTEKEIRERAILGIINLYLPRESGLTVTLNKVANFFNPWSDEWADIVIDPGIAVDPGAISALSKRLQDPEESVRVKAARALGILKGKDAIPALVKSVEGDGSNSVRFASLRALRKIGDPSVGGVMVNFLNYNDTGIRNEAVYALGRLRYRPAAGELTRLYEKQSALPSKQQDKDFREKLLDALAFIADPASAELFNKERRNPEDSLRLHAFEGLARIGNDTMVTEISSERLREKNQKVRVAQAYALYRMGRKEYLEEVARALSDRKTNFEAKQYLVELRPDELPELYALVRMRDADVREALAEIMGLIGDSRAIEPLQQLSKDTRGQVAQLANQALRRVNARLTVQ